MPLLRARESERAGESIPVFLLQFYALCVMRSRCVLSDEMFFKSVWKVFAELSVLDIFKLFRGIHAL